MDAPWLEADEAPAAALIQPRNEGLRISNMGRDGRYGRPPFRQQRRAVAEASQHAWQLRLVLVWTRWLHDGNQTAAASSVAVVLHLHCCAGAAQPQNANAKEVPRWILFYLALADEMARLGMQSCARAPNELPQIRSGEGGEPTNVSVSPPLFLPNTTLLSNRS